MTVSKSSQIREILRQEPDLTPCEIQTVLADKGVEVSRNLCKVVRHREQQSAASSKPPTERQLRRGETRMSRTVYRLSKEDWAVWDFVERYAKRLETPGLELHVMDGRLIRMQRKVRQWLEAVSTRNARRRRENILDQFIVDLCRHCPKPEKNERLPRPVIRKRPTKNESDSEPHRRLTEEERESRIKQRPLKKDVEE
ncbi:MAG: hypothetical protein CME33_04320 [Gimesia sp.]|nr:hypothetical protein [Gimesia sp.]